MKEKIIETYIKIFDFDELNQEDQQLVNSAKSQTQNAYAPYSKFHVGAAVLLENGEIISGNNQENAAYPSGLCAERVTMFYANAKYPNVAATKIAIAAFTNNDFLENPISPCGSCRQVLLETEKKFNKPLVILLYGKNGVYVIEGVNQLLPLNFTKESLHSNL